MYIVYTAGPYRADSISEIDTNILIARTWAKMLWQCGNLMVFCPQSNSAYMDGECPDEVFLKGDLELIRRAVDAVFLLPGWEQSTGSIAEKEFAEKHNIAVIDSRPLLQVGKHPGEIVIELIQKYRDEHGLPNRILENPEENKDSDATKSE